jgi:hypothetical protein
LWKFAAARRPNGRLGKRAESVDRIIYSIFHRSNLEWKSSSAFLRSSLTSPLFKKIPLTHEDASDRVRPAENSLVYPLLESALLALAET